MRSLFIVLFYLCLATLNGQSSDSLIINCPADILDYVDNNSCSKIIEFADPIIEGGSGIYTLTLESGSPSGDNFSIGSFVNIWSVTDDLGNQAECSFVINLIDSIKPQLLCPADTFLTNNADCMAVLPNFAEDLLLSDNCSQTLSVAQTPAPGSFIAGFSPVTFSASDESGNVGSCSFLVMKEELSNEITVDNGALSAVQENAIYQWMECIDGKPTAIEGAVAQSYSPENSGNFAVSVTSGTCTVISDCFEMIISSLADLPTINGSVYPNPTRGLIYFDVDMGFQSPLFIQVIDQKGKLLLSKTTRANYLDLSHLEKGIYTVSIRMGNKWHTDKIILD